MTIFVFIKSKLTCLPILVFYDCLFITFYILSRVLLVKCDRLKLLKQSGGLKMQSGALFLFCFEMLRMRKRGSVCLTCTFFLRMQCVYLELLNSNTVMVFCISNNGLNYFDFEGRTFNLSLCIINKTIVTGSPWLKKKIVLGL